MGIGMILGKSIGKVVKQTVDTPKDVNHLTLGKVMAKAAKWAFIPNKPVDHIKPPIWQVKERALHHALKNVHDPRLEGWYPKLEAAAPTRDFVREGIQELPKDHGVCADYLQTLIKGAMNKHQMQIIREYLKSAAANNLDAHTKTELWMECAQRMHYLTTLFDFLN